MSGSDDPVRVGFGTTVYDDDGVALGTVRGFDEHGFYVTTEEGIEALSGEHLTAGAPGEAELKAAGVDFIYLGSSSFLRENGDVFTAAAVENSIPVLSPYEELVRDSQALMSVAARYSEVGRHTGIQAEKILFGGVRPGDLPVLRMADFAVVINLEVAKKLGLYPPMGLLQIAETVN
jgi:hypothetical protein